MEGYAFLLTMFCWQRFSGFPGWQTQNKVFTLRNTFKEIIYHQFKLQINLCRDKISHIGHTSKNISLDKPDISYGNMLNQFCLSVKWPNWVRISSAKWVCPRPYRPRTEAYVTWPGYNIMNPNIMNIILSIQVGKVDPPRKNIKTQNLRLNEKIKKHISKSPILIRKGKIIFFLNLLAWPIGVRWQIKHFSWIDLNKYGKDVSLKRNSSGSIFPSNTLQSIW